MKCVEFIEELKKIMLDPQTMYYARYSEKDFTRKRKMPFSLLLAFFFDMQTSSLQTRLDLFATHFCGKESAMTEQAFSKARSHFDHSPFETMLRRTAQLEYEDTSTLGTWNDYFLFAVDGSFIQLPNTPQLRETFGVRGHEMSGAQAGVSILYDVVNGFVMNPILTDAKMDERAECEKHIDCLVNDFAHLSQKSILLLDRGYPSFHLLEKMSKAKVNYVMRCQKSFTPPVNSAPMGSSIVRVGKGKLPVRVCKFLLSSGEVETLLTNLFELDERLFPELYAKRWGIETAYAFMKNTLGFENFSGKTDNAIRQDFWATMVLMNAMTLFKRESDAMADTERNHKTNKHSYVTNSSSMVVTLKNQFIFACLIPYRRIAAKQIDKAVRNLARFVLPVRPKRSFPRTRSSSGNANFNHKSHL